MGLRGAGQEATNAFPRAMTSSRWAKRIAILLTLLAIYAAGQHQAMQARLHHPACHPNLKP